MNQELHFAETWNNSSLLRPDVAPPCGHSIRRTAGDLHVIGSAQLVRGLLTDDLVDDVRLMIDPLVLPIQGRRRAGRRGQC